MLVRTFKRIGTHHINNCEDAVGEYQIGQNRTIALVADGCSMGNEAHFASELFNKSIRNIAKSEFYKEFASSQEKPLKDLLKDTTQQLHKSLNKISQEVGLELHDLLTTLIFAIVDGESKEYAYVVIGDGLVVVDDSIKEFNQQNKPDYFAYHLGEDFDNWFNKLDTVYTGKLEKYIGLATDGIFTFADGLNRRLEGQAQERIIYKVMQSKDTGSPKDLQNKVDQIENENQLRATDDIGLAKIIFEN